MRKAVLIAIPLAMLLCFLAGRHFSAAPAANALDPHRVLYYVDPMHPAYKSDKPGIAPDCGMALEPVYADGAASDAGGPATLNVSAQRQQLSGIHSEPVAEANGAHALRVIGRVQADEARLYRISASVDGYIQKVSDFTTGSQVRKDDVLASFGSADLVAAEQAFLGAASRAPESVHEFSNGDWRNQVLSVNTSKLRALGMGDKQIMELRKTMAITDEIKVMAPADGFVLARNVSPGQRFERGAELYRLADLRKVWIIADIYESDAHSFQPGAEATVSVSGGTRTLHARVSHVLPTFDATSRTMKLRLEADNPGFVLRPDMFVDVDLPVKASSGLTVPADALLDSGTRKRVFLDLGDGHFEPREVTTGWRAGDRVQIVSGLAPGDKVVVSGAFLLDSESQLRSPQSHGAAAAAAPMEMKPAVGEAKHAAKDAKLPASAKDPACGMDVVPKESVAAGNVESYNGHAYYFCSTSCKRKFKANPQQYAKAGEAEPAMHDDAPAPAATTHAAPAKHGDMTMPAGTTMAAPEMQHEPPMQAAPPAPQPAPGGRMQDGMVSEGDPAKAHHHD